MERIDDLQIKGLRIIQDPELFCFSTDAVLLANFASVRPGDSVVDLGAGTGILDLLMYARQPKAHYHALEIQAPLFELLVKSIALNDLGSFIHPVLGDIKNASAFFGHANQVVVCNPPYEKIQHGQCRQTRTHDIARKEILITLEEICAAAASLLRSGGHFYLCCRANRLAEAICSMKEHAVEPKLLRLCRTHEDSEASLFLMMGRRDGHEGIRVLPDLILFNAEGGESDEVRQIYNRENNHGNKRDSIHRGHAHRQSG